MPPSSKKSRNLRFENPDARQRVVHERGLRETLQFYLIDCHTPLGKLIDIAIIVLNLAICVLFIIETYPIPESTRALLWQIEVVIVAFFIIEYMARLYAAKNRLKQIFSIYSLIDLVAILPTLWILIMPVFGTTLTIDFMYTLRGLRVFRIFRFLRFTADTEFFFGSMTQHLLNVTRFFMTILMLFFISSGLFYHLEYTMNPAVNNFGDAFYYTVVALTTVGFGDIIPQSEGGRWVTVLTILTGIILIPWQAARIVKEGFIIANKKDIVCRHCGLRFHDLDASHCKYCGNVIFQEYDGN
jgi:voltage-gated potassium channel